MSLMGPEMARDGGKKNKIGYLFVSLTEILCHRISRTCTQRSKAYNWLVIGGYMYPSKH